MNSSKQNWEDKEREAFFIEFGIEKSTTDHLEIDWHSQIAKWWIERMRVVREEEHMRMIKIMEEVGEKTRIININIGRSAVFEEVRERLENEIPKAWIPSGFLKLRKRIIEDVLSSLQKLKETK